MNQRRIDQMGSSDPLERKGLFQISPDDHSVKMVWSSNGKFSIAVEQFKVGCGSPIFIFKKSF